MRISEPKSQAREPHPSQPGFFLGSAPIGKAASPRKRSRRLFLPLSSIVLGLIVILLGTSFFIGARFTQSLHFENRELSFFDGIRLVGSTLLGTAERVAGEETGRVNILLLGRAGESYPGRNLTDTVMVLSLDTNKKHIALLSLPRDLFAPIPGTDLSTKLNSLYQYGLSAGTGVEPLRESVEEITGLDIQYSAMIDFDGFERTIDALGGIQVEVMRDIYDPRYPGKNYSYETFELKKGWQKLDGKTALKYARERHDDPEGDFGRAKRQQQIMQAVREKAWSLPTFLNPFMLSRFLESLGGSVTTDVAPEEIGRFIELARVSDTQNISTVVIDAWKKDSLLRVSHVASGGVQAFILLPRSGDWDEIREVAKNIFEETGRARKETSMEKEKRDIVIVTSPKKGAGAIELRSDIEKTFPVGRVSIQIDPALDKLPETAIIQDTSSHGAPFTADSLVSRYGLSVTPFTLTLPSDPGSLVIVYTRPTVSGLPSSDVSAAALQATPDFQEPFAPEKNPLKR